MIAIRRQPLIFRCHTPHLWKTQPPILMITKSSVERSGALPTCARWRSQICSGFCMTHHWGDLFWCHAWLLWDLWLWDFKFGLLASSKGGECLTRAIADDCASRATVGSFVVGRPSIFSLCWSQVLTMSYLLERTLEQKSLERDGVILWSMVTRPISVMEGWCFRAQVRYWCCLGSRDQCLHWAFR